jgi:hypothetical protein
MPKRIQRKRTKGWRMPADAIYVGRPSKWGNPWQPTSDTTRHECVRHYEEWLNGEHPAVLPKHRADILRDMNHLRGKDLACWCRWDQPCHADVLLDLANDHDQRPEGYA